MVFVRSTALAETYESRFSTKGVVPRRISQRERATKGPSGLRYEHPKTKPQYPCNHGPPSGREGGGRPPTDRRSVSVDDAGRTGSLTSVSRCGLSFVRRDGLSGEDTAEEGVSVTNYPVEPKSDRGEAGWGYLEGREYARRLCKVRLCHVSCGDDCTSVTRS